MKISFYELRALFTIAIRELNKLDKEGKALSRYYTNFLKLITIRQKLIEERNKVSPGLFLFLYSELEKIGEKLDPTISMLFFTRLSKLDSKITMSLTEFRKLYV